MGNDWENGNEDETDEPPPPPDMVLVDTGTMFAYVAVKQPPETPRTHEYVRPNRRVRERVGPTPCAVAGCGEPADSVVHSR